MLARTGLVALPLVLLLIGRFVSGPFAWGWNHFAYLPDWVYAAWIALSVLICLPPAQRRVGAWLSGTFFQVLFTRLWAALGTALAAGGLFALLRERSFFMGDGYLIGELVERGMPFRAFDNIDYLMHYQLYTALKAGGSKLSSFTLYRIGSVVAGVVAVWLWTRLAARLPGEPWRRAAAWGFTLFLGPVALFFGYVESYAFLFLFLTAFLLQGLRVLEGNGRLWVASAFFGAGLAFHLTAVFTGPALLFLALRAPVRPAARRWLEAALPPAVLFLVSVLLHVAEGYNAAWFRREFLEAQNTRNLWIPLGTGRGLFSAYHWKDLANLAIITAPASLMVVLGSLPALRRRLREPGTLFLLIQMASVAFFSVALDRKLGGARDWDLFAAHAGGLALLAVRLLPARSPDASASGTSVPRTAGSGMAATETAPDRIPPPSAPRKGGSRARRDPQRPADAGGGPPPPLAGFALSVAILCAAPWVLLLHLEERSIARFVSVAADFPDFQRGYAYEEVGKYYRKAGRVAEAEKLYGLAVETNPTHPRLRVLLGSIYFGQEKFDQAEAQYTEAHRLDPKNHMAIEMLGKVALRREQLASAADWFAKLVELRPNQTSAWELLGYAAVRGDRPADAVRAFRRAMELDSKLNYQHEIGVASLRLGRYREAAEAFRAAVASAEPARPESHLGLAFSLAELMRQELAAGRAAPAAWRQEAERSVRTALAADPGSREANDLLVRLQHLTP